MKKGKVFFHPIEGSGSLTISWSSGPKGDAIEAKRGAGVGFFSESGTLLCVIFDEVQADNDRQSLVFKDIRVEVLVKNGRVTHSISAVRSKSNSTKNRIKRRRLIIK